MHVLSGSLSSHPRNWGSAGVASWRAARGHRPVRCLPQLVARAFLRARRRSPSPRPSVVQTQARAPASAEEWFSRDAALAWPDRGRADSRRHLASARGRRSSMHGRGKAVVWTATSDAVVRAKARDTRPPASAAGFPVHPGARLVQHGRAAPSGETVRAAVSRSAFVPRPRADSRPRAARAVDRRDWRQRTTGLATTARGNAARRPAPAAAVRSSRRTAAALAAPAAPAAARGRALGRRGAAAATRRRGALGVGSPARGAAPRRREPRAGGACAAGAAWRRRALRAPCAALAPAAAARRAPTNRARSARVRGAVARGRDTACCSDARQRRHAARRAGQWPLLRAVARTPSRTAPC